MKRHVLNAIKEAPILTEPWPHIMVANVFQDNFYKLILSKLPKPENMEPLGRTTPNRLLYWLEKKGERPPLTLFWEEFRAELFDDLWMTLEDKLAVVGKVTGAEIVHDLPGYNLGPHTDSKDKLITGLFYLPRSEEDAKQGTVLFKCSIPDPRGKGHRFSSDFVKFKVIPFLPNSALFFVRTDISYHGVYPTLAERWSLAFDVFHE